MFGGGGSVFCLAVECCKYMPKRAASGVLSTALINVVRDEDCSMCHLLTTPDLDTLPRPAHATASVAPTTGNSKPQYPRQVPSDEQVTPCGGCRCSRMRPGLGLA